MNFELCKDFTRRSFAVVATARKPRVKLGVKLALRRSRGLVVPQIHHMPVVPRDVEVLHKVDRGKIETGGRILVSGLILGVTRVTKLGRLDRVRLAEVPNLQAVNPYKVVFTHNVDRA